MERSRPFVIMSAAMSIDGKIATKNGDSKLSSKQDLVRLHRMRANVDAILVGRNTVEVDDPLLTVRYTKGKNPVRIILDSKAQIKPRSKILKTAHIIPTIIAVSKNAPKKNLARLGKYPVEVMVIGDNKVDLRKLLVVLKKRGIKTVLAEGGGTMNWEMVNRRLVDRLVITVTPYLVGGADAITLVEGTGFAKIQNAMKLKLRNVSRQKNELVLYYS
ncbi:MAG: 2,5-diamino-6-(ribosylamino)-4(3H)-pyrimidinone 5'-phosphate reductase [Candidatus Nitrosotenuis sp.]